MLCLVHRSPFRRVFLVFVLVLSGSISAVHAAAPTPTPTPTPTPGQLDTTFVPAPGTNDAVNVVIPQPDGKVIAAGRFTFANNVARNRIARFNFNGSLDTSFDPGTGADQEITAAVLQPDGRIVVAGRFTSFNGFTHNGICRLNANGSVDQTFGLGNGINNAALALALQSDGRIIVGGQFTQVDLTQRNFLARLNTNGSVDLSFDPGIGPSGDVNAIVIQPDGRIIIGGTFIGYNGFARGGIARVLGNGALDPSFDSGVGTGGNVFALALQHTHQTGVWYLNNNSFCRGAFGPTLPANWKVVGVADFDGDGRPDYLLFNSTSHQTAIWYLSGTTFVRGAYGPSLPDGWDLVAVGDFNADGKPDYVLYSPATRQTAIWYLNNNVFVSGALVQLCPLTGEWSAWRTSMAITNPIICFSIPAPVKRQSGICPAPRSSVAHSGRALQAAIL
jgi:uncharacterized delta-60 repeat protein